MHFSDFRHFLHLCWHKTCQSLSLLAVLAVFAASVFSPQILRGQSAGGSNYNYLDFQKRSYYFGITLAYNQSNYRVHRGKNFILNDKIAGIESLKGPGFNLQIISNLKLGEYFDLRFLPGFSFAERRIEFSPTKQIGVITTNPTSTATLLKSHKIESVFVELPFQVRYKSAPYNDKRAFVMAGLKYSYDIQSKSRTRQLSQYVRVSPTDYQFEVGAGVQMFFPYFIFSPELKFSRGLGNMLIYRQGSIETNAIEKLTSQTFTLSFHFEG